MIELVLTTREQDTFEAALAWQIEEFQRQRPDVRITVQPRPIHDHYVAMVEQGGAADVDLFLCCTDWLPDAAAQGLLTPLDELFAAAPLPDWPDAWHPAMQKLVVQQGQWVGLPWHDGPEVFMVRTDFFEDAQEQATFAAQFGRPLRVPATWSEFVEVAQFFTRPEQGQWGAVCAGLTDGHNNVYDFLIQLWSRGGTLLDDQLRPQFHDEIGVEALTFLYDLFHRHRVIAPECLGMGSVESGDFYAQGHAAMMWNWCGFAAVCELPELSRIVGRNRCTRLPAGDGPAGRSVSLNIYWALTAGRNGRHPEVVRDFLAHVSRPASDKVTSMVGANGTRLSTWRDPDVQQKYPHYAIIEDVHSQTLTLPAIPAYTAINEAISRAVHRVVHEHQPVAPSLAQAAQETTEILATP